ncbi:MAG: alpha/beta fold hydrolase [Trueperaceae bacterium]
METHEALETRHLQDLTSVADPRLAPVAAGGQPEQAVATLTTVVAGEGDAPPRYRTRLQRFDLAAASAALAAGAEAPTPTGGRPLTNGERDTAPRWSPDGARVAFLRSWLEPTGSFGPAQLAVIDVDGGEARTLTTWATPVLAHVWLDDRTLLVATRGDRVDDDAKRGLGRTVNRRRHRMDGAGFAPVGPVDLVRVPLGGAAPQVVATLDHEPGGLTVAAAGRTAHLAWFAPANDGEHDEGLARLWTATLGRGRATTPNDVLGVAIRGGAPAWSPGRGQLAFLAPSDLHGRGRPTSAWVVAAGGGDPERSSDADVEASPSAGGDARYGAYPATPAWTADGTGLVVIANRAGRSGLERVALAGGDGHGDADARTAGDFVTTAFDGDERWTLAVVETPTSPGELVLVGPDGTTARLSAANDAWVARHRPRAFEARTLARPDGGAVAYGVLAPKRPRRDRAVVVQVHGGPHTNDGWGFRFEFQRLAAAGYAVVWLNPRGSSSYGEAHATAMLRRYGTVDADDVLAVVDDVLAHHARPDAPVHLTGGSYGGFMTNWLVGHTDRFRSAVTQRSICNWVSFFGTADIGPGFTEGEVGDAPWRDLEALWRQSPLAYVEHVVTPTLVLHSENDHRCPIEQAEQWFGALERLGRAETRLVRFPDEGHELSRSGRPDRRVQRIDLILEWFRTHA